MADHYCDYAIGDPLHGPYHDTEYGFPIADDNFLFARLVLEITQAGLSWATILKKKSNFFAAYDNFDIAKVAAYGETARARLLADAGMPDWMDSRSDSTRRIAAAPSAIEISVDGCPSMMQSRKCPISRS